MVILIHVIIALSSMIYASYLFVKPSKVGLRVSYGLIGATLATGTYLVVSAPAHMLETCTVGLFYIVLVSAASVASRYKLARIADQIT